MDHQDCRPKCQITPNPATRIHQLYYTTVADASDNPVEILAMSTDDGRLLFYNTNTYQYDGSSEALTSDMPSCKALGQIGGAPLGLRGRIKDFEILRPPKSHFLVIVTGGSDGAIRLWMCREAALQKKSSQSQRTSMKDVNQSTDNGTGTATCHTPPTLVDTPQIGELLATYEAGNRILCLRAFIMS